MLCAHIPFSFFEKIRGILLLLFGLIVASHAAEPEGITRSHSSDSSEEPVVEWLNPLTNTKATGVSELAVRILGASDRVIVDFGYDSDKEKFDGWSVDNCRQEGNVFLGRWDTSSLNTADYHPYVKVVDLGKASKPTVRSYAPATVNVAGQASVNMEVKTESEILSGERFGLLASLKNEGTVGSGPIELALRIPDGVRLIQSSPAVADTRGKWCFVTLPEVPPSRIVQVTLTLEALAKTGSLPFTIRVRAPEGVWACSAPQIWRDSVKVLDLPTDPMVNLKLQRSALRGTVEVGSQITYTLIVTNRGTLLAREIQLDESATGLQLKDLRPSQGSAIVESEDQSRAKVLIGDLAPGASATIEVSARAFAYGDHKTKSVVTSTGPELLPSDNECIFADFIYLAGETPRDEQAISRQDSPPSITSANTDNLARDAENTNGDRLPTDKSDKDTKDRQNNTTQTVPIPPTDSASLSASEVPRHYPLPTYAYRLGLGPSEIPRADASGNLYFLDRDLDPQRFGVSRIKPDGTLERFWTQTDRQVDAFDVAADGAVWFLVTEGRGAKLFRKTDDGSTDLVREWLDLLLCAPLRCLGKDEVILSENPFRDEKEQNTLFRIHRDGRIVAVYAATGTQIQDIAPLSNGEVTFLNRGVVDNGKASLSIIDADGRVLSDVFSLSFDGLNLVADAHGNLFTAAGEGKASIKKRLPHLFNRVLAVSPDGRVNEFPIKSGDNLAVHLGVRANGALLLGNMNYVPAQGIVTELKLPENRERVVWRSELGWYGQPTTFSTPAGDWVACFEMSQVGNRFRLTVQRLPR